VSAITDLHRASAQHRNLDSPTPILATDRLARVETQVTRLTRQTVAMLRLVGARLDDLSGT